MYHKKKKEKTAYGIIGLGRFGSALAMELAQANAELLVIDRDEDKILAAREFTENALICNVLDKKALEDSGIQNCDVVIVCIGENMESSILATLHLVGLGIPKVIAKASSVPHGEILEKLGAEVVYPERDMGIRLANRLENSGVLDFIQLSEKINVSKMLVPDSLIGKTVRDVNLRGEYGLNILALENNGTVTETIRPDYIFRTGDVLFLCGSRESLARLAP